MAYSGSPYISPGNLERLSQAESHTRLAVLFLTRGFIKDKCSTAVVILTIKEGCLVCAEVYLKLQYSVGFVGYVNVRLRCKTGGLQERAYLEGP